MSGLAELLAQALDVPAAALELVPVAGGCVSDARRVSTPGGPLFVKTGPAGARSNFEAEAAGLTELRGAHALRVPQVIAIGADAEAAFLALEWIEFGSAGRATEQALGERLATQHRCTAAAYGWDRDNAIGATPQSNAWSNDWVEFWRARRLEPQIDLAEQNGARTPVLDRARQLVQLLPAYFTSYRPVPSLLHGDLWGGNWSADADGQPVVFDPAVYYGDREADLAMTRLFGGFGTGFYAAYQAAWPLDAAAGYRRDLYNLYHVLNHYNLFGGGYLEQAARMIERLLAELGS